MKPTYKRILRELNKGNAVLAEVDDGLGFRLRLITPKSCHYIFDMVGHYLRDTRGAKSFAVSCFALTRQKLDASGIVENMMAHDHDHYIAVKKIQVLK